MVLTKILGARKAREIRARIDHQLDLWERGIHAGLMGYALTDGRTRKCRFTRSNEEEKDNLACSFHITLL